MIRKLCIAGTLCAGLAIAQSTAVPSVTPRTKPLAFGVVSIRQNTSPMDVKRAGPPQFGPTPDGWHMTNMPLALAIATAFPLPATGAMPNPDNIAGLPDWAKQNGFDIDARVSEEDLADWQKPALQPAMLQAMLQAMLAERCKIAIHRETKESMVYLLVLAKNGPKFKESDPAVAPPVGTTLPGGASVIASRRAVNLYGTSMSTLATVLSAMGKMDRPIQDRTGLKGRYDIVIQKPAPDAEGARAASDPSEMVFSAVEALGLKLQPGKSTVETLVVDHIDRPTAN